MKQIQLRQKLVGRRSSTVQMGGFELQAPKHASMREEGFVTKKGELSLHFKVNIPPSGLFSIPDTQYNRVKLRKMVKETTREEKKEEYNFKTKETDESIHTLKIRASMEVLNDVDIYKDLIVPKTTYTEEEVTTLIKEGIEKAKKGKKTKKVSKKEGQIQEIPKEDETPEEPFEKPDKWANKAMATGSIT